MNRDEIFRQINLERERQDILHPMKKIPEENNVKLLALYLQQMEFMTILVEEVGEVARALQGEMDSDLKSELVQVASFCVKWLETLE